MNRPQVDDLLKPLKPFQRRTVDHAFERLFLAEDSTSRFLVADEVGLGKTLVARGIIARAIDHLWEDVDRIDIVYICSNAGIARANLPKLRVGGASERTLALATRLTLLATELAPRDDGSSFMDNKLNFVSFTPGTSFQMGHAGGQRHERELLFHLLAPHVARRIPLMNLLQGWVKDRDRWRRGLGNHLPIEPTIRRDFDEAFRDRIDLRKRLADLTDNHFARYRQAWPPEATWERNRLIGELRQLLAGICVTALEPDLVILDEFQRFKPLIETRDEHQGPAAELAQSLFLTKAHDGRPVPTLLLSATPYKLYTTDAEIEQEDHYEDFLATTRFLFGGDQVRVESLTDRLAEFGAALKRAGTGDAPSLVAARSAKIGVENALGAVMARTERVSASDERDAMVAERRPPVLVATTDIRQYLATDAMFRAVGDRDPMPLWKSAPYLIHFMRGYKFNERLEGTLGHAPSTVFDVLASHRQSFLSAAALRQWSAIDPAHAKLREMVSHHLDRGLWRLLWVPPTLPYWPLEGPFKDAAGTTKTLLFSAWNVVPDAVSAVLSYEAERRMAGGRISAYQNPESQQRPLLRLTQPVVGTRSRHRLMLLLLPCLSLADFSHPLGAPNGWDRRQWVRHRIEQLLTESELPDPRDGPADERWEWAAPLLLDPGLRAFLTAWRNDSPSTSSDAMNLPKPNPDVFDDYLTDMLELDPSELGRRPDGLVDLLTDVALGSPAILALRSLSSPSGFSDETRPRLAVTVAEAFWSLFNRPAVIALLRQLATAGGVSGDEAFYWRLVLDYCRQGNLQAVLDEQWHLLWDQHSWAEDAGSDTIATDCAKVLVQAAHPVRSRVHARMLERSDNSTVHPQEFRIRTVFALRFGHLRSETEEHISQDAVRAAFNSPFRPFVLTSTSVGQEGLDFHPWCHRLVHWNLPGNPVDLEQREGRVHRYKGHAVRRNVAAEHGAAALASWKPGTDLWMSVFQRADEAARAAGESDLIPHWIAEGDCRVERQVPLLPYAAEVAAFERLKRQLAAYRVVFGQPRQEELLSLLDHAAVSLRDLQELAVDLSPPTASATPAMAQPERDPL